MTPNDKEIEAIQKEIKRFRIVGQQTNDKPYQSKIIREKELPQSVEEGWEIAWELTNGKFLIKKANHTN